MNTDEAKDAILELWTSNTAIEWYPDGDEFHSWESPDPYLDTEGERKLEKILEELSYTYFCDGYKTARKHKKRDKQNGGIL